MRKLLLALCMGSISLMALPTSAQTSDALHQVTGFRSARFGMSEDEVRTAIATDFKPAVTAVEQIDNAAEKTRVILLRLATLEPGPGPANVSYILGASSRRLTSVRIIWSTSATPSDDERNRMASAGLQLASYFSGLKWAPEQRMSNRADGPGNVVLFAGIDARKSAVEVRLAGVPLAQTGGAVVPPPPGAARLQLSYFADVLKPDVAPAR